MKMNYLLLPPRHFSIHKKSIKVVHYEVFVGNEVKSKSVKQYPAPVYSHGLKQEICSRGNRGSFSMSSCLTGPCTVYEEVDGSDGRVSHEQRGGCERAVTSKTFYHSVCKCY